jgi:hypothetical protein
MADRDPRTVFVAENIQVAEVVVQLLAKHDIPAEIEQPPLAESSAFSGLSVPPPEEFPVLVIDPTKVEDARALLTKAEQSPEVQAVREKRANRTGTVTATCEDCGKSSEWPASEMGTTAVCPHCQGYMDIPDPDDDWSDVDFGSEEDEAKET